MSKILIVAEHDGARLNPSTAKCVSCASQIGGAQRSTSLVLAADGAAVAAQAAAIAGVGKVLVADNAANVEPLAAVLAPQVAKLAAGYTHVFGPSTTFGKDLMPRVAALLGVGQVSDIMAVEGSHALQAADLRRQRHAHRRGARRRRRGGDGARRLLRGGRAGRQRRDREGGRRRAPARAHALRLALQCRRPAARTCRARARVVAGGRALGSADGFKIIYSLADRMGAAVGASRAAVDAGYVPNDLQVGQTGKIIAPELYIAIGISGAIQHMTGIKDARTIVAINKDGEAPIFEVADIGLVGDLFAIVPELEKQLGS